MDGIPLVASVKKCNLCCEDKPRASFYRRGAGYQAWCKSCMNDYQKAYRTGKDTLDRWMAAMHLRKLKV